MGNDLDTFLRIPNQSEPTKSNDSNDQFFGSNLERARHKGAFESSTKIEESTETKYDDNHQFKIHVAIDFGTDGCAVAFAYQGEITVYNKWMTKKRRRVVKAKTQILLNGKDEVVAFGDNAKIIYSNLSGSEKSEWKFFDRFKMCLYGDDLKKRDAIMETSESKQNTRRNKKLAASKLLNYKSENQNEVKQKKLRLRSINNNTSTADIVFIEAFRNLKKTARQYMNKITTDTIKDDEIQWIVTVPAIWSERAKDKMRTWIINAGLVNECIKNQCLIVFEPDCAALAIFEEFKKNKMVNAEEKIDGGVFNIGDKYILVDIGGGTMDVVCHQIIDANSVREIHHPTGNKLGACYIDDQFSELLEDMFTTDWMNEYKVLSPNGYLEIIDNFQCAKITFYKKKENKTHSVDLTYEFVEHLQDKLTAKGMDLNEYIKQYQRKNNIPDGSILISDENLVMSVNIWKKTLFDSLVNQIIKHIDKILQKSLTNGVDYLCLVGGFACSLYLQERLNQHFGMKSAHKLKLIIPKKPVLSVVTGAAHFSVRNDFIQSRKLKYTYGIGVNYKVSKARKIGVTEDYIMQHSISGQRVEDCFHIIASKGESVQQNQPIKITNTSTSSTTAIRIYRSKKHKPVVMTDGEGLAKLLVNTGQGKKVTTEFHFYGTMFQVYSYPTKTPNQKQTVKINYAYSALDV